MLRRHSRRQLSSRAVFKQWIEFQHVQALGACQCSEDFPCKYSGVRAHSDAEWKRLRGENGKFESANSKQIKVNRRQETSKCDQTLAPHTGSAPHPVLTKQSSAQSSRGPQSNRLGRRADDHSRRQTESSLSRS